MRTKSASEFIREWCADAQEDSHGYVVADFMGVAQVVLYPSKDEWRRGRQQTLGASDVPTIMGLTDAWRTPKQLYLEKVGEVAGEVQENEDMRIGTESEAQIKELYAIEHSDLTVYDGTNMVFISREYPFASCSLDAIVHHGDTLCDLEIKCGRFGEKWKGNYLPDNYFVQLLWQSFVTGITDLHLIARLRFMDGGATEKHYRFDATDEDVATQREALLPHCEDFWRMVCDKQYFPKFIRI